MQGLCLATVLFTIAFFPVSLASVGISKTVLWVTGTMSFLVLLVPVFFMKDFDIFEPICFVMLMVLPGTTLRSFYVAFVENDNVTRDVLMAKPAGFLILAGVLVLVSIMALTAGYMVRVPRMKLDGFRFLHRDKWRPGLLFCLIVFFCVTGVLATVLYLREMGVKSFVMSNISSKHFMEIPGSQYKTSLSYYQWAACATQPAFFLYFAWFATSGKKLYSGYAALGFVLCVLAMAFPFLNSSRSGALEVVVVAIVMWHYLRRRITVKFVTKVIVISLVFVLVMAVLRKKPETFAGATKGISFEHILDTLIGNRQFYGIDKMGQIVDAVPEKFDYQFGNTLLSWLYAPIPRTMWPEKPPILLGPDISTKVYDTQGGGGTPPGIGPELYINFHIPGLLTGMFILGLLLKFLYVSFRPYLSTSKNAVILYVPIMIALSMNLLVNCLSGALVLALMQTLPVLFSVSIVGSRKTVGT